MHYCGLWLITWMQKKKIGHLKVLGYRFDKFVHHMKWLSMPNAQPDDLFVKGIKGKSSCYRRPECIKWGYNWTKQIKNTKNFKSHCREKNKQKSHKDPDPTQIEFHCVRREQLCNQRGRKARLSATLKHRPLEVDGVSYVCESNQFIWSVEC